MSKLHGLFLVVFLTAAISHPVLGGVENPADNPVAKKPLVAVMVSDDHYDADKLLPPLIEKLAAEKGWTTVILHGRGGSEFENIDELEKADVLVIYIRRLALPKDQLTKVKKFVTSGRGIVGIRTASHGFESKLKPLPDGCENWPEFDREVLGGNYANHGKNEIGSEIENIPAMAESPILKGVFPAKWHSSGALYFTGPLKDDTTVYQMASSSEKKDVPLSWTRLHGKTKVAYTALGHQDDFKEDAFKTLIGNIIEWTITEGDNYAEFYGIDRNKFVFIPYCSNLDESSYPVTRGDYFFSGGIYDRDYNVLFKAVRNQPVLLKIAAPKENFKNMEVPENVHIFRKVSKEEYFSLLARSKAVLISVSYSSLRYPGVITYVQAMRMGKAVIINDPIGAKSYITNYENGILVPNADEQSLKNAIIEIMETPTLLEKIAAGAREHSHKNLGYDRYFADVRRLASNAFSE